MPGPPKRPRAGGWAALAAIATLWPARLAGPLDGIPLDTPLEVALIGVALAALIWLFPGILKQRLIRIAIVVLLAWKAGTAATVAQDGWCLRFVSPVPLYLNTGQVPHSWDLRADWRNEVPQCSAVMSHGYTELERFPVWFYNLPPANTESPATANDRPPNVQLHLELSGYLRVKEPGTFLVKFGEHISPRLVIDGVHSSPSGLAAGVPVPAGTHTIAIPADLVKSHWSLEPLWNGENIWTASTATMTPPGAMDDWVRPWGRYVPLVLILVMLGTALFTIAARVDHRPTLIYAFAMIAVCALLPLANRVAFVRAVPLLLLGALAVPITRRAQRGPGAGLLIALPFLAALMIFALPQAGLFTWYSSGDDWWMFQRYAYRIYMEKFWLEGGQITFWYQPFYRWIAGALHLVFGDSSVGELLWDAACATVGALFAFRLTSAFVGFRAGVIAGATTLAILTIGPAWYLFGRGLSELSSMGFLYAAALLAWRGRGGYWPAIVAAAILATLAFYTRLNNLPMAAALVVFALPVTTPGRDLLRSTRWWTRASKPVVIGMLMATAAALWLFAIRTYHYTNALDPFFGTQVNHLSVLKPGDSIANDLRNVAGSVLMILTMNDPPRADPRAIPIVFGMVSAVLSVLGIGRFGRLPLNASLFCLTGIAGALVARGTAYPGRFSVHLIPIAVTLFVCAVSLFIPQRKSPLLARPLPGTT